MKLTNYLLKTALMALCINLAVAPVAQGMESKVQAEKQKASIALYKYRSKRIVKNGLKKTIQGVQYTIMAAGFIMYIKSLCSSLNFEEHKGLISAEIELLKGFGKITLSIFIACLLEIIPTDILCMNRDMDTICKQLKSGTIKPEQLTNTALLIVIENILLKAKSAETIDDDFLNQLIFTLSLCPSSFSRSLQLVEQHKPSLTNIIPHKVRQLHVDAGFLASDITMPRGITNLITEYVDCVQPITQIAATDTSAERKADRSDELAAQPGLGLGGQAGTCPERVESKRQAAKQKEN